MSDYEPRTTKPTRVIPGYEVEQPSDYVAERSQSAFQQAKRQQEEYFARLVEESLAAKPQPLDKPAGVKHDSNKPMLALIPFKAEIEEARVWTFGAEKYEQWNWTKGFKLTRIMSALHRHLNAIKSGEDIDPESGCLHAAHIRCCAAMLIEFQGREDLDDRQPS